MNITLTRTYYNNDVTHGVLSFEGEEQTFVTLEKALPKPHQKYVNRCLPEGEYPCDISYNPFEYKGLVVRAPFISIPSVPHFNGADFLTSVCRNPPKHAICLGTERNGQFQIVTAKDEVTRFLAKLSKRLYDAENDCPKEPVTLFISRADDIVYEDTSVEQIEKQKAHEKEMMEKAALLDELT